MIAIPSALRTDAGDQVSGLACPGCHGVLQVKLVGRRGQLQFTCRIGHTYGLWELLRAKENDLERRAWAAVVIAEEMGALLDDIVRAAFVDLETAHLFSARRDRARNLAESVRAALQQDAPIRLGDDVTSAAAENDET